MRTTWASSWRWALVGAAVLCGLELARPATQPDVKVALVVGNSHYESASMELPNAAKDATDIAEALKKDGFTVSIMLDLTRDGFQAALSDFARASRDADVSLFYYAGHGVQYQGQNYLLPTDSIPRDNHDIKFKSVKIKDVVDAASEARKAKIVILDAPRNAKADPLKPGPQAGVGVGEGAGLAPIAGSHGLVVMYSAQHGKQALDAGGGGNGPFVRAMLRHINEPGRGLMEVFAEVANDVRTQTNGEQEPEIVTA